MGSRGLLRLVLFVALASGFLSLLQPSPVNATINRQISFQGKIVLNSNSTNITNATYNMQFKIYSGGDGVPGGGDETLLWTEDRLRNGSNGVTLTDGIFQVNLGSVTTLPGSVDFNNSTLWLSINLGNTNASCTPFSSCVGDGEMNPMVRFTAAPYALNSDLLDGLDSTAFSQLSGANTWSGTNTYNSQSTFNTDVDYVFNGTENISVTSDLAGTLDVVSIVATPSATSGTTQGILVQQANSANTNGLDNGLTINNADTDLPITAALKIQNSGGGGYTTIIDNQGTLISGAELNLLDGHSSALLDAASSITSTFGAIDVGTEGITTSGTIGTAATTTFTGAGGTFTGVINANGGISLSANQSITTSSGAGAINLNSTFSNASGNAISITPSYTGGGTDALTYNGINMAAFSPTNAAGTDTVNGVNIGNLTDPGASITSTAFRAGTGWDTILGGTTAGTNLISFTNFIVSNTGSLTLGNGAGNQAGSLIINDGSGSTAVTLTASGVGTGYSLTLPTAAGGTSQCLQTDSVTASQLVFAACGGGGGGDNITVNSSAAADANFLNTTATASLAGVTFTLNGASTPDDITIAISDASATVSGVITANPQTLAGLKTFNGGITLAANQDLTTTAGTGTLVLNNTVTNASDDAILITPSFTGGATDALTYDGINIAGFSPTNAAGTDSVNGVNIGNLTDPGASITSTAFRAGTGWDTILGGTTAGTNLIGFTNFTVTSGGALTASSLSAGSGTITTSGTIGTAATTTFTGGVATFSGNTNLGSVGTATAASTIHIADTSDATGTQLVTIGSTAKTANIVTLQGGGAASTIVLQTGASGGIDIGVNNVASKTINIGSIGSTAQSTTVHIADSTGAAQTVILGSTSGASATTIQGGSGNINLSTSAGSDVVYSQAAGSNFQITASAAPTVDQLAISNAGQAVTTSGVNGLSVNYVGGAAAIEASAARIDITPGTTSGGTWSGLRIVAGATGPVSGVTGYGIKLEGPTSAGAGTETGMYVGTGWDTGLDVQSGGLNLAGITSGGNPSDPATPTGDNLRVYAKKVSGRMLLKIKGPSGLDTPLQPALFGNNVILFTPMTGATISASGNGFGTGWAKGSSGGTAVTSTPTTTAPAVSNQMHRYRHQNVVTTTNQIMGIQTSAVDGNQFWTGNAAGLGGFFFNARFIVEAFPATTVRIFAGLTSNANSTAVGTNIVTSDTVVGDVVGLWHDTTDANTRFSIVTRNNATTTKGAINLSNAIVAGNSYDWFMFVKPNDTTVYYRLDDLVNGVSYEGSTATTMPRSTIFMGPAVEISNGTANTTVGGTAIGVVRIYVESDR